MKRRLGLLAAVLAASAGCGKKKPDPATLPPVAVVQDFEGSVSLRRWPKDRKGAADTSRAWSADGGRSLEIGPGLMVSFKDLGVSDWTGYGLLRFTTHNPGARTVALGLEIQDDHDALHDRHQHSFGALPGDHVIELDFSGGLWRGEENRPYRGSVKTPIDVSNVTRLGFTNGGEGPVFVDRIEIVKVAPLATPGGFAFDFGPRGSQVMAQTIGVFGDTVYDAARGHGLLAPVGEVFRPLSYPTPLLGDGLPLGKGFRVDLPGGAYLGWIAFERGGFSEGEQASYQRADLLVNGTAVTGHDFSHGGPHFLFQDTEVTDLAQIERDLVRPAHAISTFRFEARAGENVFSLAIDGAGPNPLRVAGLMLAPDTPEGAAFLRAHEERQTAAMKLAYPPEDRGRRHGRAAPAKELVAEPLPLGEGFYPRDWPVSSNGVEPPEMEAITGQVAAAQLALFSLHERDVHVTVEPLTGPGGATLPAPKISHGRYLPARPLGNGPVWLALNHYRPEPDFHTGPDLGRAVLIEHLVPQDAAPGSYSGAIVFSSADTTLRVPLRARVHVVSLPAIPIPVGLFMSALPFGPEAVGEDRFWELTASLLDEQARAGLTCLTGGAGLFFHVHESAGTRVVQGERALFYLTLARVRGPVWGAVNYGGFFPPMRMDERAAGPFADAFNALSAKHDLPPFYFSSYDEPSTPSELETARAGIAPMTRAGLYTMGFLTRHGSDTERLLDATYAPVMGAHTTADVRALAARGKHPWAYNNGMDRWGMGLHLWRGIRAGIQGRLEWIGLITQGFAFDDLDGREPANSAWLVHDRFGPMPSPKWLAAREGLLDVRVRLSLEEKAAPEDPALAAWPEEGYGKDRERWTAEALARARTKMLEALAR